MMKKICCILLMLFMALPALAEENLFAPYTLTLPEGAVLEAGEGSHTVASGLTRVVVILIPRVPDAEPAEAVLRMMAQFDPDAVLGEDLSLAEGYVGVRAMSQDKLGEGVDQLNVMVLSNTGDLLILSGYDLAGDEEKVHTLLEKLLSALAVDGQALLMTEE